MKRSIPVQGKQQAPSSNSRRIQIGPKYRVWPPVPILDRFTGIPNYKSYFEDLRKGTCKQNVNQLREFFNPCINELNNLQKIFIQEIQSNQKNVLNSIENFRKNIHFMINLQLMPLLDNFEKYGALSEPSWEPVCIMYTPSYESELSQSTNSSQSGINDTDPSSLSGANSTGSDNDLQERDNN